MKVYQLPKEFATRWLEALRSGKYKQAQEVLAKEVEGQCIYCCLGVAACIQGVSNNEMFGNGELNELSSYNNEIDDYDFTYLNEMGIPDAIINGKLANEVINLNDKLNYNFNQIADWIEANVELI